MVHPLMVSDRIPRAGTATTVGVAQGGGMVDQLWTCHAGLFRLVTAR
jgi:hypothetical protein